MTVCSAISCIGRVHPNMIQMTTNAWICIYYVMTFASVIAYFSWNTGVEIVGAGRAAPYINLLPAWTVLLVFITRTYIFNHPFRRNSYDFGSSTS
ncbi:EamA family transporter [Fictibacillus sp. FJAT-27399]|uniref:EamA family transporter n=1 Tax=Fictibacillus sp. FJAT-27399 TaxID=1729689 RepID=UPI0009E6A489